MFRGGVVLCLINQSITLIMFGNVKGHSNFGLLVDVFDLKHCFFHHRLVVALEKSIKIFQFFILIFGKEIQNFPYSIWGWGYLYHTIVCFDMCISNTDRKLHHSALSVVFRICWLIPPAEAWDSLPKGVSWLWH